MDEKSAAEQQLAHWQRTAAEAEQMALEQMEALRQAQQAREVAENSLIVQRQTIASQQAELNDLRRNLDRSTGIIRSLEQRLAHLQEQLASREATPASSESEKLQTELAAACARADLHERAAAAARSEMARAQERIITLERQLLQLKSIMERSIFGRSPNPAPAAAESPAPAAAERSAHSRVQLPTFLQAAQADD